MRRVNRGVRNREAGHQEPFFPHFPTMQFDYSLLRSGWYFLTILRSRPALFQQLIPIIRLHVNNTPRYNVHVLFKSSSYLRATPLP